MKNKTLEQLCNSLIRDWRRYKEEAIKTGNFEWYCEFLKIVQGEFGKLYARVTRPELVVLVEEVLKITSCEIKGIMIKYKQDKIPF